MVESQSLVPIFRRYQNQLWEIRTSPSECHCVVALAVRPQEEFLPHETTTIIIRGNEIRYDNNNCTLYFWKEIDSCRAPCAKESFTLELISVLGLSLSLHLILTFGQANSRRSFVPASTSSSIQVICLQTIHASQASRRNHGANEHPFAAAGYQQESAPNSFRSSE